MNETVIRNVIASCRGVKIVVASKYLEAQEIAQMASYGLSDFGENRVDALLAKQEALKEVSSIHWHFIGHLQSNKAKLLANRIECLHSLDSLKVARILNEEQKEPLNCFVELHLTDNEAKSGVKEEDLPSFLEALTPYTKIRVIGFMAMSDKEMDEAQKRAVFAKAKELATQYGYSQTSMGMSDDYLLAIEEGSSTVRLGRILLK